MRKNRMMRLASALLILTMVTTCAISGTFAKYVTEETVNDSARIAKWGVGIDVTGEATTFEKTYAKDDTSFTLAANTVVGTEDLVAPGTSGTMADIKLSGTPEVAVRVTYEVATFDFTGWEVDGDWYCPVVVKINTTEFSGMNYESADAFKAAIVAAVDGYSKDYEAGTDLSTVTGDNLDISWAWAYTGGTGTDHNQSDVNDTKLGDKAVAENLTISIKVDITVTQID